MSELTEHTILPEPTGAFHEPAVEDPHVPFAIYEGDTGKVRITGTMPYSMLAIQKRSANEGIVLEWLNDVTHYVDVHSDEHVGRPRPALVGFDRMTIAADNQDAATINLPVDCTVVVDGVSHSCPAGPLVFTADSPGVYTFVVKDAFPYVEHSAEVVAQ